MTHSILLMMLTPHYVTLQKYFTLVFTPCSAVDEVSMATHSIVLYSVKC